MTNYNEKKLQKHRFSIKDLVSWHANLIVTHKCGRGCEFCSDKFVDTSDVVVSLKDVDDYLKYLAEVEKKRHPDMSSVLILGGEPTKVPFDHLKEIAKLIHHYGFNAVMTTNGQSGAKLLELDGYIDFINISNYGRKAKIDKDYLYQFKKTTITVSKLITRDMFPTFDSFKKFIQEAKNSGLDYRFSTLQENTPNLKELHPSWVDEELLPNCKLIQYECCSNAIEYDDYVIKIMHFHSGDGDIIFPPYPNLYPNGNASRDFLNEDNTINYRDRKDSVHIA